MGKRVTVVFVALLAVCVLSPAASAAPRRVGVSLDPERIERAKAKADARLRKAAAKASRAARSAGLRVSVGNSDAKPDKGKRSRVSLGAARRDAIKRAIRRRLQGGNLVRDER